MPVIGIGASATCDGQVLVAEDILGLFSSFKPRFVDAAPSSAARSKMAAARYAADVRGAFLPGAGAYLRRHEEAWLTVPHRQMTYHA